MLRLGSSIAAFALLALCASAAHATNHLSCTNSSSVPDASLTAFNFDIEVAYSNTGGGGSVGKPTTSLTVVFPLNSQYGALEQMTLGGLHSSTCVFTESPGSSVHVEVTMKEVVFTSLKLVKGESFNVQAGTAPLVELTLAYTSVTVATN